MRQVYGVAEAKRSFDAAAADVHARIQHACHRFLGLTVEGGFRIPPDAQVARLAHSPRPMLVEAPTLPAALAVQDTAERIEHHLRAVATDKRRADSA